MKIVSVTGPASIPKPPAHKAPFFCRPKVAAAAPAAVATPAPAAPPVRPAPPAAPVEKREGIVADLVTHASTRHSDPRIRAQAEVVGKQVAKAFMRLHRYAAYASFRQDLDIFLDAFNENVDPGHFLVCMALVGWGRYIPTEREISIAEDYRRLSNCIPSVKCVVAEHDRLLLRPPTG